MARKRKRASGSKLEKDAEIEDKLVKKVKMVKKVCQYCGKEQVVEETVRTCIFCHVPKQLV